MNGASCRRWFTAWSGGVVGSLPSLALMCPVCFQAKNDANRVAFISTTIFMTVVPLLAIGLLVWWAARRLRALDAAAGPSDAGPPRALLDQDRS